MTFATQMRQLEKEFRATAAEEGSIYLPNFTPAGPVDAVLIAMEPSRKGWAPDEDQAARRIASGFRNFMWSTEAMILHWAARRHLCESGQTYHITDISKGAMPVVNANVGRSARYDRWAPLLKKEIELVSKPRTQLIAIGGKVSSFLRRSGISSDFKSVIHYSPLARAARNAAAEQLGQAQFRVFGEQFSMQILVEVATEMMREKAVPLAMSEETIDRLSRGPVTESEKKLAFAYSMAFSRWRAAANARG